MYKYGYYMSIADKNYDILTSQTIKLSIISDYISQSTLTTALPSSSVPGDNLYLFVIISDSLGGISNVTYPVNVIPLVSAPSFSRLRRRSLQDSNNSTNSTNVTEVEKVPPFDVEEIKSYINQDLGDITKEVPRLNIMAQALY